jgi:6-phospho-3-hexuloisomerase
MDDLRARVAEVTREIDECLRRVDPEAMARAVELLHDAPRVFVAGAGRSGLAMRALAMRLAHLGKSVHVVGETTAPPIVAHDLLIIGSGSGSTASLEAVAARAGDLGADVLLVTIMPDSPIARLATHVVQVPAPSPKAAGASGAVESIQPMGSLFEQCLLLLGDIAVLMLMERDGIESEQMFARHANLE